ncbi:MFS general substrate transporter [Athelia psychrophila]|uniref:MFS general substrate transporter n=1 Tax=Athelia psychrophila TaxID=1759441 RepID=A0A165ZUT0_9AGAM|nr:MFS general substrate transporter [Fibularhizoctonia sp. CBS 109695]
MAIGIFLVAMDGTIVVSSYAAIGSELKELQNTSWIATSYLLTLTSFQPLYGKLSDIFGRKACLLFAYVTFAIGCLLCGLAQNMSQLIAARAFAGIGGGGMTTISSIIMSDIVPLRSRGTWQGLLNIIFATGSAIGAPLGGLLAGSIGWRWSFLIQVPAMVVAIVTVAFALHLPTPAAADFWSRFRRVDFLGAITLVASIFFLLLGLNNAGNVAWSDKKTVLSLVAFVALFLLFCVVEMTVASEPFAPKRIVVNRSLIASYMVNFFGVASAMTMIFHIALYYQAALGMTAVQVGLWLLPSIFAGVAGSLGGGLIMQASGKYYWLTISGYCSLLVGSVIVVFAAGVISHSMVWIVVGFVILSLGNGNGITASLISLIANAGEKDQAIATASMSQSIMSVI